MHTLPVAVALTVYSVLVASSGLGRGQGATLPYVQWAGPESHHAPGFVLVRDQTEWLTLWGEHTGTDTKPAGAYNRHAAPEVDFGRCVVVAFFRGPATNEDGEVVRALDDVDGHIRVRFSCDSFQTASFEGEDSGAHTTPFGIWVLPATDRAIVVEEGSAELKDTPLAWREVQKFAPR